MENKHWGMFEKVHREADKVKEKLKKGLLISQKEAALVRESDLYKEQEINRSSEKNGKKTLDPSRKEQLETTETSKSTGQIKPTKKEKPLFNIDNKEQQIEFIKEAEVYYSELEGREKNLEKAFSSFEKNNEELLKSYQGKDILLKVNLVDPHHSQACTDIGTIRKVIELIKKYNPKKIFVGDIPSAMGKVGKNWNELEKIYKEKLGYIFNDKNVELINLEDLKNENLKEDGLEFEIKNLDQFGGIINISRPKMHGEFGYTGCVKNLMGLMTQKSRENVIHMNGKDYNSEEANRRLNKFSSALLKNRPDIINISDGTDFIIGHEHIGVPKKTDFAIISRNPFNADNETVNILGLNKNRAAYLYGQDFPVKKDKLKGNISRNKIYPSNLESKQLFYESKGEGRFSSVEAINDSNFLNRIEVKRRHTFVLLDSVWDAFRKFKGTSIDEFEEFLKGQNIESIGKTFLPSRIIKNSPYKNIPEFSQLVREWVVNKKKK